MNTRDLATGAARNNVPNTPSGTSDSSPTLSAVITDAAAQTRLPWPELPA